MTGVEYRIADLTNLEDSGEPVDGPAQAELIWMATMGYCNERGVDPSEFAIQRLIPGEGWEVITLDELRKQL